MMLASSTANVPRFTVCLMACVLTFVDSSHGTGWCRLRCKCTLSIINRSLTTPHDDLTEKGDLRDLRTFNQSLPVPPR